MKLYHQEYIGLTTEEVEQRILENKRNDKTEYLTKSYKDIVFDNLFTFFNFMNILLFICIVMVKSYENGLFIFIIVCNTTIGIFQEVRAKRILDQISFVQTSKYTVIRNNEYITIPQDKLVLDDQFILMNGQQIPCDATLLDGMLEVDESLLTGESHSVVKSKGDSLYSGSYVMAGKAIVCVYHVGQDNYIDQLTKEAKKYKNHSSKLQVSLDFILKKVSIIIIPLGVLIYLKQYYITGLSLEVSVVTTVAALLGMIPEGLVLLTSIALSVSVIKLVKSKVLVQELFCIETLAYVDTLCLDKTGTLTKGSLEVIDYKNTVDVNIPEIIGNMLATLDSTNSTSLALETKFTPKLTYKPAFLFPFSSVRKYSAVSFYDEGTYYLGAFQSLFPNQRNKDIEAYASLGYRVICLGYNHNIIEEQEISNLELIGYIILSDVLREDVKESLDLFTDQGVTCYILSGDDPLTIQNIAKKAGLNNQKVCNAFDLKTKQDILAALQEHTLFGRVSPQQKKDIVLCLKELGHTVAMTGDGVNDILAFKEADCSIAMNSGNDACKNAANIVLLDNQFSVIHDIVNEGRRVIHNITASASMFLIKTFFSIILCVSTILFGSIYPFQPIQLSIISSFGVGIPCFLLTYESNYHPIKNDFIKTVFLNAFPTACLISIISSFIVNIGYRLNIDSIILTTICVVFTGWNYMFALKNIYSPLSKYRSIIICAMNIGFYSILILGKDFLSLTNLPINGWIILFVVLAISFPIKKVFYHFTYLFLKKRYK